MLSCKRSIKLILNDVTNIVPHIFPTVILNKDIKNIRNELLKVGIETGQHYKANHNLTLFKKNKKIILKNTDFLEERILSLPLHPSLKNEDIVYVSNNLLNILNTYNE